MTIPVGVLIACANRLLRESIARILNKRAEFRTIGAQPLSTSSGEAIIRSGADVVVLDSLQFVIDDATCFPKEPSKVRQLKCVLVAMEDDEKKFVEAVRLGVLGFVPREASAADVVTAIRAVAAGEAACPPRFAKVLFDYVAKNEVQVSGRNIREELRLTRREQQLIPLIDRGLTNKEIANELNLSEQTIKSHIHRILRKAGVGNRGELSAACSIRSYEL
jgi:DNA-binding NarL/FixJ family response regulator